VAPNRGYREYDDLPPYEEDGQSATRAVGRAARATASAIGRGGRSTGRWVRRTTRAQGAAESGLANLIDVHAIHSAGDSLLTVALASTLFFSVPVGEARGKVALYLLITMAPFAVVAPIVGPLLDKFRGGRRYSIAATLLGRALLAWVIAGAVGSKTAFELYPAAFGALILSKAYGVSRGAVVPRVVPEELTLVRANARLTLFGVAAATIAAPISAGLSHVTGSPGWSLRLAALVYITGVVFALRLPRRVDSNEGESRLERPRDTLVLDLSSGEVPDDTHVGPPPSRLTAIWRRILPPLRGVGPMVGTMLRANAALRCAAGFLTLFFAFLIRNHAIGGVSVAVGLGVLIAGASLGSMLGTFIGSRLRTRQPEPITISAVAIAAAVCTAAAIAYGIWTIALVALVIGITQSIAKLSLDSVIQRDVVDDVRTSAFARSETVLQLSWVVGGAIGLLPLQYGNLGLALAAVGLAASLVITWQSVHRHLTFKAPRIREARAERPAR
jgi:MFS family permease